MARIRSIHPSKRGRKEFLRMSLAGLAAWDQLQTLCDDWGVFRAEPEELEAEIFPRHRIDLAPVLEEWCTLGLVRMFEVDGQRYGAVKDFCVEQSPKKPRPWYPLPSELVAFVGADQTNIRGEPIRPPHGKLVGASGPNGVSRSVPSAEPVSPQLSTGGTDEVQVPYASGTDATPVRIEAGTGSEPVRNHSPYGDGVGKGDGIRNPESEMDSDSGPAAGAPAPSDDVWFEEFWAIGPRRTPEDPKMPARTRFLAAVARGGIDPRVINAGRRRFAARCRALGDKLDPQYMAATERWIAEMRWIDEGVPDDLLREYGSGEDRAAAAAAPPVLDPRWAAISKRMLRALGADVHASWVAPLGFLALEDGTVRLAVKTRFAQQQIFTQYGERLLACCQACDASIERLELVHEGRVATVGAERPRARGAEKPEPAAEGGGIVEQKLARAAVMAEGVAQLNGYEARGETRAIATLERWAETVGGNYVLIARLLADAAALGREGADALQWLEQQVGSHAAGGVLPLKPVEAKHAPPAKRGGNRKRRRA